MKTRFYHITLGLIIIPFIGFSQSRYKQKEVVNTIGFAFDVGITTFFGDIDEGAAKGDIMNNMAYRASVCKSFSSWFILGGQVLFGNLSGEKKRGKGEVMNYQYFKSKFVEYSLDANVDLIPLFSSNKSPKFNLCVDIGVGVFTFKSKLYNGKDDSVIDSYGYAGNLQSAFVVPVGLKITYAFTKHLYAIAQTSSRIVNSDLIDAKAGNNNSDYYNYTSVGFIYRIYLASSSKNVCPAFK